MTWIDLVRKYFPDANDKQCDFILWEKTAFPLVLAEIVEKQLQQEYQMMMFADRRSNRINKEAAEE
ncbi:hypothetical protein CHCC14600_2579 [Bacillus licheniformis]|uniref:hypothetical protein n=1 Tax=Bacillus subtilis group TaxID=653685 RepID=UPI0011A64D37|nr:MULTISPECIES: hypothetical protein [Bacillus subtilis group]MDE1362762.1 hypothetical protein [Bacillus paralicheniformis]MDE1457135.1 hypothetical protein [Bacillus licheniformis]TWL85191.1 hypothetical protein CHCC15311_0256 [Bacillus licheniformis]TWM77760.1 hypothetical protein CHCC14808_1686 [Bacillus licheniformis]TWM90782.1 hypothetical protein CHCC14600_2579 [Bacillus licheniformis]